MKRVETLKRFAKACASLTIACFALQEAASAQYPDKPIKIIVPLAPGGATDTIARVIAQKLAANLSSPVVVENRTGAGGIIGMEAAAKSAADGYTLFVGNVSTNALNQTIYASRLSFTPNEAFTPVTMLATIPHFLVSSSKFEPSSVSELVSYAKANPGTVNHASPGTGSYSMIDMLRFEKDAQLDMVHIPYSGGAGSYLVPLVSNEVQIAFVNASSVLEMVKAGKLRALGVTTDERLVELPDLPTMAESGFPDSGTNAWQGLFVPAGTPKEIVDKLHAEVSKVLVSEEIIENFNQKLIRAAPSPSPEEFKRFIDNEVDKWANAVKTLNVKIER